MSIDEIPWIDTYAVDTLPNCFQCQRVFIVNISNQRYMDPLFDFADGECILFFGYSYANHFTPDFFQTVNLRDRTFYIAGVRGSHRLYHNGRIASYCQVTNMYLPGFPSHSFRLLHDCLPPFPYWKGRTHIDYLPQCI